MTGAQSRVWLQAGVGAGEALAPGQGGRLPLASPGQPVDKLSGFSDFQTMRLFGTNLVDRGRGLQGPRRMARGCWERRDHTAEAYLPR